MLDIIFIIIKFLIIIVPILLIVATLTLLERKVMASIQIRRGPNVIGFGILQPLADGLKLLIKEFLLPLKSNKFLFILAPILFLTISFATWSVIPFELHVVSSPNQGILCFLAFSSLSVYGILLGGWASNSRYAFLGALRSASQMLSYELVLSLLVLLVCLLGQSLNLTDISISQQRIWFIIPLAPFFIMYIIAILAETNRTPFDLPEAEAELVAGYSVEYSSGPFAFYFIAEYCNIIIWSFVTSLLFLGAWYILVMTGFIFYIIKALLIMIFFCWVRAALPRYRWDQLMLLAWRAFLPMVLLGVFFAYSFFEYSNFSYFDKSLFGFFFLNKLENKIKKIFLLISFFIFLFFISLIYKSTILILFSIILFSILPCLSFLSSFLSNSVGNFSVYTHRLIEAILNLLYVIGLLDMAYTWYMYLFYKTSEFTFKVICIIIHIFCLGYICFGRYIMYLNMNNMQTPFYLYIIFVLLSFSMVFRSFTTFSLFIIPFSSNYTQKSGLFLFVLGVKVHIFIFIIITIIIITLLLLLLYHHDPIF